jgi:gamma-glutamyltranspeptidase/glutathione hydrolase
MHGVVSAPQPLAVEAGADILRRGGNAVDAALACAFMQGVVDPQMCGLGGGGVMLVHDAAKGKTLELAFYAPAPLAATPDMFEPLIVERVRWGGWRLRNRENEIGYRSICVPTFVKAADLAARRFGTRPWADLIGPAMEVAAAGAPVYHHVHDRWLRPTAGFADSIERHSATPAAQRLYMRGGSMLGPGERMPTDELARTLGRLAEHGAQDFYEGEIARAMLADMQRHGGLLSDADLRGCAATERSPLWGRYRDLRIAAPAPPGGGLALLLTLALLEPLVTSATRHNGADHAHHVAECLKLGLAVWKARSGDPRFVTEDPASLLRPAFVDRLRSLISDGHALKMAEVGARLVPDSRDTTQVSVIDAQGNAVAMTHTLGLGSGVVTEGLGFMYNNAMMLFDPNPGQPNSIAPGRIRQHATASSLAFQGDAPALAIGAPGGHGIISGVAQSISNLVDFGMSPIEAVSAPRLHCEGDTIEMEARYLRSVAQDLQARGHPVNHSVYSYDYTSGRPHLARRSGDGTRLDGAADPRGGGMAIVV